MGVVIFDVFSSDRNPVFASIVDDIASIKHV